jgi:hypothetical protein
MSLRIVVKDDRGAAKIQLLLGHEVIGLAHMSWASYLSMVKTLLMSVAKVAQEDIAENLARLLWQDAQSMVEGAVAEAAKEKLLSFGWTTEKINQYASELGRSLAQKLANNLPEHR